MVEAEAPNAAGVPRERYRDNAARLRLRGHRAPRSECYWGRCRDQKILADARKWRDVQPVGRLNGIATNGCLDVAMGLESRPAPSERHARFGAPAKDLGYIGPQR